MRHGTGCKRNGLLINISKDNRITGEKVNFRTPTGNFWNPFLMIPRIILELTGEPHCGDYDYPAANNWRIDALSQTIGSVVRATNRTLAWTSNIDPGRLAGL